MKRWIHANDDLITADDIRTKFDHELSLVIDLPNFIAAPDDDYRFFTVDLNKAVDFLNSKTGHLYIEEFGNIYNGLLEASYENEDCGVTVYPIDDNRWPIVQVFIKNGLEVPSWVYG